MELTQSRSLPLMQILGGSLLMALSAYITIPLSFTPVPITLPPTIAVFLGIALGPRVGALAVIAYLIEGMLGLPVFANTALPVGILRFLGPTGGYLIGYVPAAFVAGWLARKGGLLLAVTAGHLIIYAFGVPHLAQFVGWDRAMIAGCYPFLPGCVLKSSICATILGRLPVRS